MTTRKPKLWERGERCECPTCGMFFSTTGNFDAHRTGDYATGRTCLSPAAFAAKGYIEKDGVWVSNAARPDIVYSDD